MKEKGEGEVESTSTANSDMPVEKILEAELAVEPKTDTYIDAQVNLGSWYEDLYTAFVYLYSWLNGHLDNWVYYILKDIFTDA